MPQQPKSADQPPSLARRHFIAIAATTARRLAAVSVTSSAFAGFNIREAAAERSHDREGRSEFGDRYERGGRGDREGRSDHGGGRDGRNGGGGGGSQGRDGKHGGGNASGGGGRAGGGGGVSGSGNASGGGNSSGSGSASGGGNVSGGKKPSGSGSSSAVDYDSGGGGFSGGGGYSSGGGSSSGGGYTSGGLRCFGRGTRIQTADGEVAVEDLTVGTPVMTTNGAMPVKWIGHQTLNRNGAASWHPEVVPVRIARFAIDDQTPQRDLCLSQEHALLIDGALIPVKYLVNGRSIALDDQASRSDTIEYFHVELDTHEVIFAEGLAAETFRYRDGEIAWDNLGEYRDRHGDHKVMSPFAPVHSYPGIRAELLGLARLAASHIVDVRDPIHLAYDRLAERAFSKAA